MFVRYAALAQLVEQHFCKVKVPSSSLGGGGQKKKKIKIGWISSACGKSFHFWSRELNCRLMLRSSIAFRFILPKTQQKFKSTSYFHEVLFRIV
jgi:hypothetical protein